MNRIVLSLFLIITAISASAQDTLFLEVYYVSDRDLLSSKDQKAFLAQLPSEASIKLLSYRIESSCDDIGSEDYNLDLSNRRSKNMEALIDANRNYSIIPSIVGNGERPLNPKNTEEFGIALERSVNRSSRVIMVYEKLEGEEMNEDPQVPATFENLQVGQKMVLDNILFIGGHDEFLPESYPALDTLLAKLQRNSNVKVKIIGHVCCTPDGGEGLDLETNRFNLSKMRAQAVYLFLINKGIEKTRMTFEGKGGSEPLGKGEKYDRRVELEITSK